MVVVRFVDVDNDDDGDGEALALKKVGNRARAISRDSTAVMVMIRSKPT